MAISYEEAVEKYNDYVVYFPQLVKFTERAKIEWEEDLRIDDLQVQLTVPTVDEIHQMYIRALGE